MFKLAPYNRNPVSRRNNDLFSLMDDFFNDDFLNTGFMPKTYQALGSFKVDVKDQDDSYVIEAELPGVDKKDISIDYNDNKLVISVNHNEEVNEEKENYVHRERRMCSMERSFYVKDIKADEVNAKLENGILSIYAPKLVEVDTSHRIEVQ